MKYYFSVGIQNLTSAIMFVCLFFSQAAAYELVPHTATYTAKIKKGVSIKGKAVRSLAKTQDGQWLYSFNVESFAADIKESVVFDFLNNEIKPISYNYKLSPFLARNKKRSVRFDWNNLTASSLVKDNLWRLDNIPDNTYDRLSYQLQLLIDVSQKQLPTLYNIAHKARLRPSRFDILDKVNVITSLGSTDAHLIKKVRDDSSKRETHLWISVSHPFLLLKMIQKEKDGEEYEINISSAQVNGKAISFKATNTQ